MNPTAAPTSSSQAMQQMQQFQSGMKTPEQQLQEAQQNLGTTAAQQQVSGLRQAINNTTNLLNNVAPSVMGRTGNSLVTSAQANAQIANEQQPISQELGKQTQDYNQANADYSNLQQKAESLAGANTSADQNRLNYLQSVYQALYGQEQSAAQQAEQKREFDAQLAAQQQEAAASRAASSVAAPTFGSLGGSTSNGSGSFSGASQRSDKGFNFTDPTGRSINALQFAQGHGLSFRDVLQYMANKGDQGAKLGLTFIGNDGNADPTKVVNQSMANLYRSLTGRSVGINRLQNVGGIFG